MIVAVTGASGYVGRFVVSELLHHGVAVRALARRTTDRSGFDAPLAWVEGDLLEPDGFDRFVDGADALVHAALVHVPGRYRGGEGEDAARFVAANLWGSLELMAAARRRGVGRCVFLSSRAVYGAAATLRWVSEADAVAPDTLYGACKASVEAFVSSFGWGAGWQACALRPTGVYGLAYPAERSKWYGLVRSVLCEEEQADGHAGTEVHGSDLAQSVWLLLQSGDVAGRVFNCSDIYVSHREIAELVQSMSGSRGPLPPPPAARSGNVMATQRLERLGLRFSGRHRLENTVAELIAAVRAEDRRPRRRGIP